MSIDRSECSGQIAVSVLQKSSSFVVHFFQITLPIQSGKEVVVKDSRNSIALLLTVSLLFGCANPPPRNYSASQGAPRQQVDSNNEGAAIAGAAVGAFVGFALGRILGKPPRRGYDPGPPPGYYRHNRNHYHRDFGPPPRYYHGRD